MVQKQHLTPLSKKGHVTVHKGKGAMSQRLAPGERESLTTGGRFSPPGRYPTAPTPPPSTAGAAPPIPSPMPMAGGGGEPDADDLG